MSIDPYKLKNVIQVHWVYPYSRLRGPNVLSTLEIVDLCASPERPKVLVFVSSTAVLECPHYGSLSDRTGGVRESDDLAGSGGGALRVGYGQSKWVAERLLAVAGQRGLRGYIVRPGYVVGDSVSGGELA